MTNNGSTLGSTWYFRRAGQQRLGLIHQEGRFKVQDHRRPNQEYQEPTPRFQDCNLEFQAWSSSNDEE